MEVLITKKILILQTAFLGDAVLTLPMIQQLKLQNEDLKISVLCIPSTSELFNYSKAIDDVIVYDKRKKDKSLLSFIKLVFKIRNKKFEKVYSPHRSLRSTIISFFSGARESYGFDRAVFSQMYKKNIHYDSRIHEVARNLSLIGFDIKNEKWKIIPEIEIPSAAMEKIDGLLKIIGKEKKICIAPGSVWSTKVYPEKYFSELIEMLLKKNFFVFLIGGKEDKYLCDRIAGKFSTNVKSVAGELSIVESVDLLKNCDALICNDSAPTHLAMIAGIPTLTIYCSTVPAFGFYPYNSKSKFVSFDELECKPCGIHGHNKCPIKTYDCAFRLTPQIIFQKLEEIIAV